MKISTFYQNIQNKINGPTGIWTRGLCLARAALSQSELRAHILSQIDDLVFDCYISNINVLYISHSIHTKIDNHIIKYYIKSIRRWSSRRFPYGYLVTTSPSSKNRDSNTTNDHILIPALFGWCDGRCVQGAGTYSPRDCDTRLLRIPASWGRVTALNPNYD